MFKTKPVQQKSMQEWRGKNIVLHSIKIWKDGRKVDNKVIVTPSMQRDLLKCKVLADWKNKCKAIEDAIKINSRAVKNNEANHTRERGHVRNPLAKLLKRPQFIDISGAEKIRLRKLGWVKNTPTKKIAIKKNNTKKIAIKKNNTKKIAIKKNKRSK